MRRMRLTWLAAMILGWAIGIGAGAALTLAQDEPDAPAEPDAKPDDADAEADAEKPAAAPKQEADPVKRYQAFAEKQYAERLKKAKAAVEAAEAKYNSARLGSVAGVSTVVENGTSALNAIDAGLVAPTSAPANPPAEGEEAPEPSRAEMRVFNTPAERSRALREEGEKLQQARDELAAVEASKDTVAFYSQTATDLHTGTFGRFDMRPFTAEGGKPATPFLRVYHVAGPEEMSVRWEYDRTDADASTASRPFVVKGVPTEGLEPGGEAKVSSDDVFEVVGRGPFVDKNGQKRSEPVLVKVDVSSLNLPATPEDRTPPSTRLADEAPEWLPRYLDYINMTSAQELAKVQQEHDEAAAKLRDVSTARVVPPPKPGQRRPKIPANTVVFSSVAEKTKATAEANNAVKLAKVRMTELQNNPGAPLVFNYNAPDGMFFRLDMGTHSEVKNQIRSTETRVFKVASVTGPDEVLGWLVVKYVRTGPGTRENGEEQKGSAIILNGIDTSGLKKDATIQPRGTFEVVGRKAFIDPQGQRHMCPYWVRRDVEKYLSGGGSAKSDSQSAPAAPGGESP